MEQNKPVVFPFKCPICMTEITDDENFKKHVDLHVVKIMADVFVQLEKTKKKPSTEPNEY